MSRLIQSNSKEDVSTHFLLRLTPSLEPVGTIRTYTIPVPVPSDSSSTASSTSTSLPSANSGSTPAQAYKLTRLAVLKEYRQFRFGRALVLALHEWVRKHALGLALTASSSASSSSSVSSVSGTSATATEHPPAAVTIVAHSQIPAKGFYARCVVPSPLSDQRLSID
ncbi:unnamed protein product [Cyclocybe aegerita]|uniref:Uncharacterized protein n=1 Tax=Cyclocybe aegerita TaxID=1973307 RepID=A0A8S0VQI4_CYCAE|nr:unnamed protein product [Cyclocybe aegerita]